MNDLQAIVEQFHSRVPEFVLTDIVSVESGLSIAGDSRAPDFDASIAAAAYADVVKANLRALDASGLESASTEDILVTTDRLYILVRMIGNEYYHVLVAGREGNLGLARAIMKKFQPSLERALGQMI